MKYICNSMPWLTLLTASVLLTSCDNNKTKQRDNAVAVPILDEQEAIRIAKEELLKQKPFGIAELDDEEFEISTDSNGGKWVVTFTHIQSTPGSYFTAVIDSGGEVEFWPGR